MYNDHYMFKLLMLVAVTTILMIINASVGHNFPSEKNASTIASSSQPGSSPTPTIFDYIVMTETPTPTNTPKPSPTPTITPVPTATPVHLSPSELDNFFTKYADNFGIDRQLLRKIAVCESFLNPSARFRDYGGLYQFSETSWITTRQSMNLDSNPALRFNPEEAIKTAAYKIKTSGIGSWPNCSK